MKTTTDAFIDRVSALVEVECERQRVSRSDVERGSMWRPFTYKFSWTMRGSAGRAVLWLRQQDHSLSPAELVEGLAERCDAEVRKHPRVYTKSHLLDVIEIAGREAERMEVYA